MKKIFILLFSAMTTVGYGATWTQIRTYNGTITDLKTFSGNLWIGGDFSSSEGQAAIWTSMYSGTTFSHNTTAIGGSGVSQFEEFGGQLYNVGGFNLGGNTGVSKWSSGAWISEGTFTGNHSAIVGNTNQLYVASNLGQVSYKNGTAGTYSTLPTINNTAITAMAVYNNELYVAGTFVLYGTTMMNNIARWDGTTWQPLGTGINAGVVGTINSMIVHNGDLYVAGNITYAGGIPVNGIARWSGSAWNSVGTGVTGGQINDMVVHNNQLYVVGDFTMTGSQTSRSVAKWDGTTWIPLSLWDTNHSVNTIEEFNNQIYIGTEDNDTAQVYRMDSETGLNEMTSYGAIKLYPNPVVDNMQIILDAPYHKLQVIITDMAGRIVYQEDKQNAVEIVTVNVVGLSKGDYILMLMTNDKKRTLPFVKQ